MSTLTLLPLRNELPPTSHCFSKSLLVTVAPRRELPWPGHRACHSHTLGTAEHLGQMSSWWIFRGCHGVLHCDWTERSQAPPNTQQDLHRHPQRQPQTPEGTPKIFQKANTQTLHKCPKGNSTYSRDTVIHPINTLVQSHTPHSPILVH